MVRGIVVLTHHDVVGNYVVKPVVAVKRFDLVVGNPAGPAGQRAGVSAVIDNVVIAGHVVALNRADPRSLNVEYRVADESQVMRIVAAERVPRLAAPVEVQFPEFQVRVPVQSVHVDHRAVVSSCRRAMQATGGPNDVSRAVAIGLINDPRRRRPASRRIKSLHLRISSSHNTDLVTRLSRFCRATESHGSIVVVRVGASIVPRGRGEPHRR